VITLKVTPDGEEPYTVTATSRDVLLWEKSTKDKSFVDLVQAPTLVDLYRVAHIASHRQGLFAGNYATFEQTCEVNGIDEDDPEPDPTQSAASADDSSSSPSQPASPRRSGRTKANEQ
jgi:hypothetical protein